MRQIITFCLLTVALAIFGSSSDRAVNLRKKILSGDTSQVFVVAHRGDWRFAPENSIAAIEHSIEIGVDIVELDIQLSKDSVLFVIHDSKLDRTTTGKGKISDWTADSLRTLKLKNGAGIRTKHSLPTLEEAMLVAKGKVLVNLDKADRYFDLVIPVLEKTGTAYQVIMKSNKAPEQVLNLYGDYLDKIIYMPKVKLDNDSALNLFDGYLKSLNSSIFELSVPSSNFINNAYNAKSKLYKKALIWYNTLWDSQCAGHDDDAALSNPDGAYGFLIYHLGARIIQTDRAESLLKFLRARNLHE